VGTADKSMSTGCGPMAAVGDRRGYWILGFAGIAMVRKGEIECKIGIYNNTELWQQQLCFWHMYRKRLE